MTHFDYFVIGGGSGGMSGARRAASYGARVGIAEGRRLGGTCVNVGCVPKKIMFNAAHVAEILQDAHHHGFNIEGKITHSWEKLKESRDKYIARLNLIYQKNLDNSNVKAYKDWAQFIDAKTLKIGDEIITADKIVIAVGGKPSKLRVPGEDNHGVINSDGFFELPSLPKKVAVIGAGYIAVELTHVLAALGSETHLLVRGDSALRNFEDICRDSVMKGFKRSGVTVHTHAVPTKIEQIDASVKTHTQYGINEGKLSIDLSNGEHLRGFDTIIVAIGRTPELSHLGLENIKLAQTPQSHIIVDEFQNTSVPGVYAVGDVCGKVELTPMAIAAARRLADRLFDNKPDSKADYDLVPTVIFSSPPVGVCGFTEAEAKAKFGEQNVKVYVSSWVNMFYGPWQVDPASKPQSQAKLVTLLPEERVVGLHIAGDGADEILQGFGVAMKMGATKADLDRCVAIHPTASEEMVLFPPWGLAPEASGACHFQAQL